MRVAVTVRFGQKEERGWLACSFDGVFYKVHMGALGWAQQDEERKESWAGLEWAPKKWRAKEKEKEEEKEKEKEKEVGRDTHTYANADTPNSETRLRPPRAVLGARCWRGSARSRGRLLVLCVGEGAFD